MGKLGAATAARIIIESVALDAPPLPIIEILEGIFLSQNNILSPANAREEAERLQKETLRRLQMEINSLLELGRPPRITFNSSSAYMVQGACFIEPHDTDSLKKLK